MKVCDISENYTYFFLIAYIYIRTDQLLLLLYCFWVSLRKCRLSALYLLDIKLKLHTILDLLVLTYKKYFG
jgi:hypothetical protein